jgi:hypothetical protein
MAFETNRKSYTHLHFGHPRQHQQPSSSRKIDIILVLAEGFEHIGQQRTITIARYVLKKKQPHGLLCEELL